MVLIMSIDKPVSIEIVTDMVLIAERKLAVLCIHCGGDFDDDDGWSRTPVCSSCYRAVPSINGINGPMSVYHSYATIHTFNDYLVNNNE